MMYIYDGISQASKLEVLLKERVSQLALRGLKAKVAAVLFEEDAGSRKYSEFKLEAATRIGIHYDLYPFSIKNPVKTVLSRIEELNNDPSITGIIIQKPTRRTWWESREGQSGQANQANQVNQVDLDMSDEFQAWWNTLYDAVDYNKDVDGLHPSTMVTIKNGNWKEEGRVLPATVRAVRKVLKSDDFLSRAHSNGKYLIAGKSDLLGIPLFHILRHKGKNIELIGRAGFDERMKSGQLLMDADVIISATGEECLIRGEMLKDGVALIDVGEPKPDIDITSVAKKATFITPVPGGIGPLTVVSLLENAVYLVERSSFML